MLLNDHLASLFLNIPVWRDHIHYSIFLLLRIGLRWHCMRGFRPSALFLEMPNVAHELAHWHLHNPLRPLSPSCRRRFLLSPFIVHCPDSATRRTSACRNHIRACTTLLPLQSKSRFRCLSFLLLSS